MAEKALAASLELSWSKPRTYDFNQSILDHADYEDLCTLHILLGKINNSIHRIQLGLTGEAVRDFLTNGAYQDAVRAKMHIAKPLIELILWTENALDGYYPLSPSDLSNFTEKIRELEKASQALETVHDVQLNELGTLSTLHLTVIPATFKILYMDLKSIEKQLKTMRELMND